MFRPPPFHPALYRVGTVEFNEKKVAFEFKVKPEDSEVRLREDLYLLKELIKNPGYLRLRWYLDHGREELLESLKRLSRETTDEKLISRHASIFNGFDVATSMPEFVINTLEAALKRPDEPEEDINGPADYE